jgi:predicted lipoprotein with Yx(FWY)xxD motif
MNDDLEGAVIMAQDFGHRTARRRRVLAQTALTALSAAGVAGLLAACSSTSGTTTSTGNSATSSASSMSPLSTRQFTGLGTALVDQSGMTVYTPDQEADGTIKCTAQCLSFWTPLTVDAAAKPTVPSGVTGTVGTIKRPDDGQTQVTFNGKPLYTFRLDQAPGDDKGANFQDSFGGTTFTWRAISTPGAQGTPGPTGSPDAPGYGSGGGNAPGY